MLGLSLKQQEYRMVRDSLNVFIPSFTFHFLDELLSEITLPTEAQVN
jgi:hypothetical protein